MQCAGSGGLLTEDQCHLFSKRLQHGRRRGASDDTRIMMDRHLQSQLEQLPRH
jgi:hypothetical protein